MGTDTTTLLHKDTSLSSIYQMKGKENDASLSEEELYIAELFYRIIEVTALSVPTITDWAGSKGPGASSGIRYHCELP